MRVERWGSVCVCVLCWCVVLPQAAQREGLREAKKHIIYREIYKFKVHNHNKHAG